MIKLPALLGCPEPEAASDSVSEHSSASLAVSLRLHPSANRPCLLTHHLAEWHNARVDGVGMLQVAGAKRERQAAGGAGSSSAAAAVAGAAAAVAKPVAPLFTKAAAAAAAKRAAKKK